MFDAIDIKLMPELEIQQHPQSYVMIMAVAAMFRKQALDRFLFKPAFLHKV